MRSIRSLAPSAMSPSWVRKVAGVFYSGSEIVQSLSFQLGFAKINPYHHRVGKTKHGLGDIAHLKLYVHSSGMVFGRARKKKIYTEGETTTDRTY